MLVILFKKKKTDYNAKITEIENKVTNHKHDEYITTPEFNKLATDACNARIAQANLITKTDFDAKLSGLNRKITKNKLDHILVQNGLNKLKIFDFGHVTGKSLFEEDDVQNYLVFQPVIDILNLFLILVLFLNGYLRDYLLKLLSLLQHLIIVLHLQ